MKMQVTNGRDTAKRILFLAWKACGGPTGLGVLQDRGSEVCEDDVWSAAVGRDDYGGAHATPDGSEGTVNADYVMGRMMKLRFSWGSDFVELPDHNTNTSYNAWAFNYPTFAALGEAATAELAS